MPPAIKNGKNKAREGRQSRSRNTTPSSIASAPVISTTPLHTSYLEIPIGNLMVPTNISYDDILERHGGSGGIPDPNHLTTMVKDLRQLCDLAAARNETCNTAMRALSQRRKEVWEEQQEREREQAARIREIEERESLKREAEEEEESRGRKGGKLKKQKKEPSSVREERPLNHGAHGLARQDGLNLPLEASPSLAAKNTPSPSKRKREALSEGSSSLSEASPLASPSTAPPPPDCESASARPTLSSNSSLDDARQPPPAASTAHFQTFGANPVTFDDPTCYEILPVTDDMTDEEKREIYCVSSFPHDDLHDLIAGTPPDKDFSNAVKPSNQVSYNTFNAYLESYLRPLREEDIGFLTERGDRTAPFIMPRRGKRHYTEVWAEEDGASSRDSPEDDKLPPNQPRGTIDQMNDDIAETDQISSGPVLNRLLSTMRFEHRPPPSEDKSLTNGLTNGTGDSSHTSGDLPNGVDHEPRPAEETTASKSFPPATSLPSSDRPSANAPNLSHAQVDERLKAELRHLGFLSPDNEPDYDAHYDDEIAERLRHLQAELRRVSVLNGARKQKVLEMAQEQMAYQEYTTIHEDLDGQVQQAYMKRTRTLDKTKKNVKRPGGVGGGSHPAHGGVSIDGGISKPGIGDVARQLMTRRAKWQEKIGPVFRDDIRRVRSKGESIFTDAVMEPLIRQERERAEEEDAQVL